MRMQVAVSTAISAVPAYAIVPRDVVEGGQIVLDVGRPSKGLEILASSCLCGIGTCVREACGTPQAVGSGGKSSFGFVLHSGYIATMYHILRGYIRSVHSCRW